MAIYTIYMYNRNTCKNKKEGNKWCKWYYLYVIKWIIKGIKIRNINIMINIISKTVIGSMLIITFAEYDERNKCWCNTV